jgi:sulfide:quinone oxidoreductase
MYLAADNFRRKGVLEASSVEFWSGGTRVFGVEKYEKTLKKVIERYGIKTQFKVRLEAVDGGRKTAIFRGIGEENKNRLYEERFDLLHVTPPQGPPDVVATSPLADERGWVASDKYTLQHPRWPNVFSLGDCAGIPASRTGAAIRKQMPVVAANLAAVMEGRQPEARYNGYSSCPILTGYGRLVLAEFDYDLKPCETFPFDQSKERWTMFVLKRYILPWLYWNKILTGKM